MSQLNSLYVQSLTSPSAAIQSLTAANSVLGNVQGPLALAGDLVLTGNIKQALAGNISFTGAPNYAFGNVTLSNLAASTIFCANIVGFTATANIPASLSAVSVSTANLSVTSQATINSLTASTIFCANVVGSTTPAANIPASISVANVTTANLSVTNQANINSLTASTIFCANVVGLTPTANIPASISVANVTTANLSVTNQAGVGSLIVSNAFKFVNATQYANTVVCLSGGGGGSASAGLYLAGYPNRGAPAGTVLATDDGSGGAYLTFGTAQGGGGAAERLRITNTGLVGVNTSTPAVNLDVNGAVRASNLTVSNQGTITNLNTNALNLVNAAGVNLSSTSTGLQIQNYNQYANSIIALTAGGSGSASAGLYLAGYSGRGIPAGSVLASDDGSGGVNMTFSTAQGGAFATERARITNAGLFGIGTSTPQYSLDVNGTARTPTCMSYSGSFAVSAAGTYSIPFPNQSGQYFAGKLTVSLLQISNGAWVGMADVAGQYSNSLRPYLTNAMNYTYTQGNTLVASLQPYGGANNGGYFPGQDQQVAQVSVTTINAATTLKWSLVNFMQYS